MASNRLRLFPSLQYTALIIHDQKGFVVKIVSLKGDKLIPYTVTSLDRLPEKLHHRNFNEKSNEKTMVIDGILSEWHPFNKSSPCSLKYKKNF